MFLLPGEKAGPGGRVGRPQLSAWRPLVLKCTPCATKRRSTWSYQGAEDDAPTHFLIS